MTAVSRRRRNEGYGLSGTGLFSVVSRESVKHVIRILRCTRYPVATHQPGYSIARVESMSTRRKIYWWFRFVLSGRFLETFLNLRRRR
jgi:hypothetical protein